MYHWNGCQLVAIDTETTGLDCNRHEIWNLAMVPLDSNCVQRQDVLPLDLMICPQNPEFIDWEVPVHKSNRHRIADAIRLGFTQDAAVDIIKNWIDKLGLPLNRSGYNRCKIIPLGHNYGFERGFMMALMGEHLYEELFHYHYRCTMTIAGFLCDRAAVRAENVPFPKFSLQYLARNCLKIDTGQSHTALDDAVTTSKVYKALLDRGGLFT